MPHWSFSLNIWDTGALFPPISGIFIRIAGKTTILFTTCWLRISRYSNRPAMKSNKQRRQEIKAQRLRRIAQKARISNARPVDRSVGAVEVTPIRLRATTSYGIPDFVQRGYYQDRPFRCKDCGVAELWTAAQQQWWYEQAQGDVWTVAVRCRACRSSERARQAEARRIHFHPLGMNR